MVDAHDGLGSAPSDRRDFVLLLVASLASLSNYAPLLSVVPLWAASGGVSGPGVGATTAVMMAATSVTVLAMGPLLRWLPLRRMFLVGTLVMGAATPGYLLSADLAPVLAVSAVRGVGFALVVVAGPALVAELVPAQRLARGSALYGLASGLPHVVALPLGVWMAQAWGFAPVFLGTTALALLAAPLMLAVHGGRRRAGDHSRPAQVVEGRTSVRVLRPLLRPAGVFFTTTMALGGLTTFLPLALAGPGTASLALLAQSLCMITGRLAAGVIGDGDRSGLLLVPGAVVCAVGTAAVALGTSSVADGAAWVAVVGAGAFGLGLGVVQNDSLVTIMRRAGRGRHGTGSAVWNFAFDAGTGVGAVLVGVVVAGASYPWGFAVAAGVILLAAPAGISRRRRT